jgi:hypothetical protein
MTTNTHLTGTYIATIDADIHAARQALRAIDPMAPIATQLAALGLDDRAVWARSCGATGAPDLGSSLLWRFGPPDQTARIRWRIRLDEDCIGRTVLTIAIRAGASDNQAHQRLTTAWPIIETIAHEHAKRLRHALDEYAADPSEIDRPMMPTAARVAA